MNIVIIIYVLETIFLTYNHVIINLCSNYGYMVFPIIYGRKGKESIMVNKDATKREYGNCFGKWQWHQVSFFITI